MDDRVRFGDGIENEFKNEVNQEMKRLIKTYTPRFFAWLETKIDSLPEKLKQGGEHSKEERKIADLWAEYLFEEGLIPKAYQGLPDNLLLANSHQEGYLDGLYAGYALAMMALADHDAPKALILSVRDEIRPNLTGRNYKDTDELISRYRDEKYSWIDRANTDD